MLQDTKELNLVDTDKRRKKEKLIKTRKSELTMKKGWVNLTEKIWFGNVKSL